MTSNHIFQDPGLTPVHMNIQSLALLCILGSAACSKIFRNVVKPSPSVFRNKLHRFKRIALFNEPLLRDANVTDKVLSKALWEEASHQAGCRIPFMARVIQNCGKEQDSEWLENSLEDARAHGIDEQTIERDLVPFLSQVSAFMKSDGQDIIDDLPRMQMELLRDYYANLFFQLKALWDRLDEKERKEFRANVSPYFLKRIVPDAAGAYLLTTLPKHVSTLQNPDLMSIFNECLGSVNGFLSSILGRAPTHDEIEGPLFIDLIEASGQNQELAKDFKNALTYLIELMRTTEDIMGIESNVTKMAVDTASQTVRE